MADAVEAVCVSSLLHGESFFRKPQPTYAALIWFASVPVACCAFPACTRTISSIPLPHGKCGFALVFAAFATQSFLEILGAQRLPIDLVATPDSQQQLAANAVTFLKGACRERPHDQQLIASSDASCCHIGCEDTRHVTDVEVSDDTVSQRLA